MVTCFFPPSWPCCWYLRGRLIGSSPTSSQSGSLPASSEWSVSAFTSSFSLSPPDGEDATGTAPLPTPCKPHPHPHSYPHLSTFSGCGLAKPDLPKPFLVSSNKLFFSPPDLQKPCPQRKPAMSILFCSSGIRP